MTKTFVCRCEDVPLVEVEEAIAHGYDDIESLRRYTAVGTGPCQGKACMRECVRMLADHHGVAPDAIGVHTMRPPLVPIPLGHLADLDEDAFESLLEGPGLGDGPPEDVVSEGREVGEGSTDRPVRGVVDPETVAKWREEVESGADAKAKRKRTRRASP